MTSSDSIDVSIVISTWNNARRLQHTLESLSAMTVPPDCRWEVLLIDNNCTDRTAAVAETFSRRLPLRYLHEPRQGLSFGRNRGIDEALGHWLLFTDDDVQVPPHWLGAYWRWMQRLGDGYMIGGPIRSAFEGPAPSDELLQVAPCSVKGLFLGEQARELAEAELFLAANWACARSVIRRNGGFSTGRGLTGDHQPLLLGEETDLMVRLSGAGIRSWYSPDLELTHFVPASKASLRHVAWRAAAEEYATVRQSADRPPGAYWLGVPRWEYRMLLTQLAGLCWSVLRRHRVIEARVRFARARARVKAWRDAGRARSRQAVAISRAR